MARGQGRGEGDLDGDWLGVKRPTRATRRWWWVDELGDMGRVERREQMVFCVLYSTCMVESLCRVEGIPVGRVEWQLTVDG